MVPTFSKSKNILTEKEHFTHTTNAEAVVRRCSVEKVFLEISQNSQENTCARVSFLIQKSFWRNCFPVNFAKFLRTPFFYGTSLVAVSIDNVSTFLVR